MPACHKASLLLSFLSLHKYIPDVGTIEYEDVRLHTFLHLLLVQGTHWSDLLMSLSPS